MNLPKVIYKTYYLIRALNEAKEVDKVMSLGYLGAETQNNFWISW